MILRGESNEDDRATFSGQGLLPNDHNHNKKQTTNKPVLKYQVRPIRLCCNNNNKPRIRKVLFEKIFLTLFLENDTYTKYIKKYTHTVWGHSLGISFLEFIFKYILCLFAILFSPYFLKNWRTGLLPPTWVCIGIIIITIIIVITCFFARNKSRA